MFRPANPSDFPALYHIHNSWDADDLPFWLELARRRGDPVLELGCGTGRVLIPLAEAGHAVVGIDNDADMLGYLRSHLPTDLAPRVRLFQQDLCEFRLEEDFQLILLPCNTYTTLPVEKRICTLETVRHHLRRDGLFSVSIPSADYLKRLPKNAEPEVEEIFPHPLDGEPVQVSSAWRRAGSQVVIDWYYDHLLPEGSVERLSYQVIQNIIPVEQLLEEFRHSGLTIDERYGDFDGSPFDKESIYLILIAGRSEGG